MNIHEAMAVDRAIVEKRLTELLDLSGEVDKTLKEAMNYSVQAGGKRLRPVMNIMANRLLGGSVEETLDIACAIEFIHSYSLIHDDLPAMDNDDLRRGKPTNHKVFGEAFAILAGDGLLNYAFEAMLANALRHPQNCQAHLQAIREVAQGAGVYGMLTGQCADIGNEGKVLSGEQIRFTHIHKTGDMFKAALVSGLLLCNPSPGQVEGMASFGYNFGLTFQIIDDILDAVGDQEKLGKPIGSDQQAEKYTFVTLYGVEKARTMAKEHNENAKQALSIFGESARPLLELADSVLERDH